jgi:hypothetical protein
VSAAPPRDIEAIRHVLSRATGTGWEAAYRQDVGALLDEVERLRSINDDYLREMGRQHAKLREQAHDAAKERAAVVAFLRRLFPENMTLTFMMDGVAADIERGDHLKENEK